MKRLVRFTAFLMVLWSLNSCSYQYQLTRQNVAPEYMEKFGGNFMQKQLYHLNDSTSELYIRVVPRMIPEMSDNQLETYSLTTFRYSVFGSKDRRDLIKSETFKLAELLSFDKLPTDEVLLTIPLNLRTNRSYWIELEMLVKQTTPKYSEIAVYHKITDSPNNFKIVDENNGLLWSDWISQGKKIKLVHNNTNATNCFVKYYKPEFSPAKAPYAESGYLENPEIKPFDIFQVALQNGESFVIQLPGQGAYVIQPTQDAETGKTVTQFYTDFPQISSDAQKVFALRYLTPQKEFALMLQDTAANTLKEFWFFEGRKKERSQEMMSTYYSRMQRANTLFTTYKEGWKTDRGMIFMVYGPPDGVYYQENQEVWEYGNNADYNDLKFVFTKNSNQFYSNEYYLERSCEFKNSWHKVVENWRNQ